MRSYPKHVIFILLALFLMQTYLLYGESYRVVRGDTLYSIAKKYSVSVKDLMALNGIANPSALALGMDLVIPGTESPERSSYHSVVRGDTYYSISRQYGMTVEELLRLNRLSEGDILSIGQTLSVASSAATTPSVTSPPASSRPVTSSVPETNPQDRKAPEESPSRVEEEPLSGASGPALVFGRTGREVQTPEWPVTGPLYSVAGDFEGVMIESVPSGYVEAVAGGEVVWAGPYWEFGEIALIESDGFIYFYGGNSDIFVNVGQEISEGTRIGRLENIDGKGNLYFTIFKEGKVIDLARAGN